MGMLRRNGRARTAIAAVQAPVRAAIYRRVSSDERLSQEFNSLHAQREFGESYVAAHRGEGWIALPDDYSDGGFTGANTNRPGLKRLLADIEARKVDAVVVYKLDRLSRSMRDFLNLLDFFERHDVAFVSVSQSFDTSTPIGRMTLNLLASFGEFERQVIAERTKDKLGAARRRGKYVGGYPVLGYDRDPAGGRLLVNESEAETVREIFCQFLEVRSLVETSADLTRRGITLKRWTTKGGKVYGGGRIDKTNLRRMLVNHVYIGKVLFEGQVYDAEHEPVVPRKLFDRVQKLLAEHWSTGSTRTKNGQGFLLRGIIRCTACDAAMVPTWTRKANRTYRYYSCRQAQVRGHATCPTRSIPALKVEEFVIGEIKRIGKSPELQAQVFHEAIAQLDAQRRGARAEARRLGRELVAARAEVERLVGTLSRTTGSAADAVGAQLEKVQGSFATLESRLAEVRAQEATLAAQHVDEADVARALETFDPVWDVLLIPERERVLRLLIAGIRYDGSTGRLEIDWRLAGFGELVQEVGGA